MKFINGMIVVRRHFEVPAGSMTADLWYLQNPTMITTRRVRAVAP